MNVFNVLTSFKFEVAAAIFNAKKLQSATNEISGAATNALDAYKRLSFGIAGNFGLGFSGVVGSIYQAINAAEKFEQIQNNIANIIGQNAQRFNTDISSTNAKLAISEQLMKRIVAAGEEFALPQALMLEQAMLMAPVLLKAGVEGENFKNVIDITRGLLKSAPIFGIDPEFAKGQLMRAMMGGASMGDPLFRALSLETKAFQENPRFKGKANLASSFNLLNINERVTLLAESLTQFGNDSEIVARNMKSLSFQATRFKDSLFGFNGLFIQMGRTLRLTLINAFDWTIDQLHKYGREIVSFGEMVTGRALNKPRQFTEDLFTIEKLGSAIETAGTILKFYAIYELLKNVPMLKAPLEKIGKFIITLFGPQITKATEMLGTIFKPLQNFGQKDLLGKVMAVGGVFKQFAAAMGTVFSFIFRRLLPMSIGIFLILSFLNRARAFAKVSDILNLPKALAFLSAAFQKFYTTIKPLIQPFVYLFDTLAKAFGYLLEYSRYANLLGGILDFFSNFLKGFVELFIYVQAELRGIFTVLFGLFDIFRPMEMYNFKNLFGTIKKDFKTGYDDVIKENQGFFDAMKSGILSKPLEEPPIPLINQNVNMNVYQDFKEKQDPDRIAFTLQQVLVGVAQNPRQSSLRSFQGSNLGSGVRMIP